MNLYRQLNLFDRGLEGEFILSRTVGDGKISVARVFSPGVEVGDTSGNRPSMWWLEILWKFLSGIN